MRERSLQAPTYSITMEVAQEMAKPLPQVALLCSPCMGHLIPFADLARRLVADHAFAATLIFNTASASSEPYSSIAAAIPDGVHFIALPEPPPNTFPPGISVRARIARTVTVNLPRIRSIVTSIAATAPLAALVIDMVGSPASDIASELGIPCYMFFTSPWMTLSMFLHLPALDATHPGEYRDAAEPFRLPGCIPLRPSDLCESLHHDRSSEAYAGFLRLAEGFAKADGFLVNTFEDLEPGVLTALNALGSPVHPVGPLVWTRPVEPAHDRMCLNWLDRQPRGSVVYVSFGSGGTLTWQQTAELALGLEMSGHRFIWAVKSPDDELPNAAFFGGRHVSGPLDFLPEGFLERTKDFGLIMPSWAPQTAVLGHVSTGCFLTHCGWNSVLESILKGVPMIAWPMYAEQRMNAAMLSEGAGVAVRIEVGRGGLASREEVASVIKLVMEGEEGKTVRKRIDELQGAAVHALSEGGTSSRAMSQVAQEWKAGKFRARGVKKFR